MNHTRGNEGTGTWGGTLALRRAEAPGGRGTAEKAAATGHGRARYEIVGAPLETVGGRVHLDRELPPGGAEEYNAARKRGVRSFAMWTGPQRQRLWTRVVTASADEGAPVRYDVYGGAGEYVGSATRERSFTSGHVRTRWSAQQADGPMAVGYKGRWFWWCIWWLIFPAQCVLAVASLIAGGDLFRMPRRVGYRSGGARVLDFGRGLQDYFRLGVRAADWDPRMLAALTALHCSHDGIMGDSGDKGPLGEGESPTAHPSPAVGA